jgi:DNA-binding response OmpR family regulator
MKILIVEDEGRVAELIKRGLEEENFSATIANSGSAGKGLALNEDFDALIIDIILPEINGLDLCKEIRRSKPNVPIIMLTALGTTDDKVEGFDAGADDYLVKPFDFRELLVRIRALLKRNGSGPVTSVGILKMADLEMNPVNKSVVRNGNLISLTPKEFKLLEYMLRNPDRVLSRAEISDKVWDMTFDTGTNFIDVYINYLRKKLDREFAVKLIHTKVGMGFMLSTIPP